MATRVNRGVLPQFRTLFHFGAIGELTDGQLLELFTTRKGEAAELAFAALVERHGPMVMRVCRHALGNPHDTQDAFQATFLVLVQQAHALWVRDSLGPWLHRIARRVATRARASTSCRAKHETGAAKLRPCFISDDGPYETIETILHEEIDRLSERCRCPLILCDLEGLTHELAARHLGWPLGTVKSRLARARQILRERLTRRGMTLPMGVLIAEVFSRTTDAAPAMLLVQSTARAALSFSGRHVTAGLMSEPAAILAREVVKAMFLTKWKLIATGLLISTTLAAGTLGARTEPEDGKPRPTSGQTAVSGSAPKGIPAFISQSRAMMIARLEQELVEARQRLEHATAIADSPQDPLVVQTRKTVDSLQGLLTRIDDALVNAVETHPTMFDFSNPSPAVRWRVTPVPGAPPQAQLDPKEKDLARAKDRIEWSIKMFMRGYVSKKQLEQSIADYEKLRTRPLEGTVVFDPEDQLHGQGFIAPPQQSTPALDPKGEAQHSVPAAPPRP